MARLTEALNSALREEHAAHLGVVAGEWGSREAGLKQGCGSMLLAEIIYNWLLLRAGLRRASPGPKTGLLDCGYSTVCYAGQGRAGPGRASSHPGGIRCTA